MTSADFSLQIFYNHIQYEHVNEISLGKVNILVSIPAESTISALSLINVIKTLDFGSMWYLIRPNSLCIQFLFVSTDTVVWLTSVPESPLTTLPLTWLRVTTPVLTGLSPFGTLEFMSYIHHSRRTQGVCRSCRLTAATPHTQTVGNKRKKQCKIILI